MERRMFRKTATAQEIQQAMADKDWWESVGTPLGWSLAGWTFRQVAHFRRPKGDNYETVGLTGGMATDILNALTRKEVNNGKSSD